MFKTTIKRLYPSCLCPYFLKVFVDYLSRVSLFVVNKVDAVYRVPQIVLSNPLFVILSSLCGYPDDYGSL